MELQHNFFFANYPRFISSFIPACNFQIEEFFLILSAKLSFNILSVGIYNAVPLREPKIICRWESSTTRQQLGNSKKVAIDILCSQRCVQFCTIYHFSISWKVFKLLLYYNMKVWSFCRTHAKYGYGYCAYHESQELWLCAACYRDSNCPTKMKAVIFLSLKFGISKIFLCKIFFNDTDFTIQTKYFTYSVLIKFSIKSGFLFCREHILICKK